MRSSKPLKDAIATGPEKNATDAAAVTDRSAALPEAILHSSPGVQAVPGQTGDPVSAIPDEGIQLAPNQFCGKGRDWDLDGNGDFNGGFHESKLDISMGVGPVSHKSVAGSDIASELPSATLKRSLGSFKTSGKPCCTNDYRILRS